MLFITGLLTLLAIAQAGGDHIKGGVKGGSVTQQKVAQEDIIPSPFGTKVIQQEASDPLSKTARGTALHHAVKTAASTHSKSQLSPGLHHAASSPVIQDQVTIEDPASGSIKSIKTVKTAATARDPIARAVLQTTKTVQDPVPGFKQIKTVKMIDPVKPSFSQEDKQVRDPIARPFIQTVKSVDDPVTLSTKRIKTLGTASSKTRFTQAPVASEDPSASVVTKSVKTTVKTAEPSNLRSKTSVKTSQKSVDMLRISNTPLSVVEAAKRNTLTSSAANAALLSSQRGIIQTSGVGDGPLLNALSDSQTQPGSGLINELGEMILDEETLQTLQNAGGIINENGRIALNDEGIKILQNMRGGSLSSYSTGISGTGMSDVQSIRSGSIRTSSAAAESAALSPESIGMSRNSENINAPAMRSRVRSSQRSQAGSIRSGVLGGSTTSFTGSSRSSGLPSSQSTSNAGARVFSSNVLSSQGAGAATLGGSVASGTAIFNGKEISIDGLKEGQIFDENLRPILSDIGRIESPVNVAAQPRIRSPQRAPQSAPAGALRTSAVSGVTRTTVGTSRSSGVSPLRTAPNVIVGSSGARIASSQRASQEAGISRTTGSFTSGTALFNGKEISVDGLKEGQLFDENLRPITPGASISSSGQIGGFPSRGPRPGVIPSSGLRSPAVISTSRGAISRSRTSSTVLTQSAPNVRTGPLTTTISSGQGRAQAIGGTRSGGALTSGKVLFNGKEISVDGLKEGQLFDENLRPITPGASISSSGQIGGVPSRGPRPGVRPGAIPSSGLRSPAVISASRGAISRSRTSSTVLTQSAPNVRAGSLTTTISSGQGRAQAIGGTRSGGALTSGKVLFNGKEISVDGLKEGQLFDENLRPITPGASISSSGQIGGVPSRGPRPGVRPGAIPSSGLRSPAVISASRGAISRSRTSSTVLTQSAPNVRAGSLTTTISSGQGRAQAIGGTRSGGALTSGKVLFNGKEISVDGLKEGQLFDENLRPITPGASISSSGQIGGVPSRGPRPGVRPGAIPSSGLRSPAVISTSRGAISRSRTSSTVLTQSAPNVRAGPLTTTISSDQGRAQAIGGTRSGGALSSGTVLFNGKEISVDGLKEGQLFDENLRPISPGASISSSGQISSVPLRSAAPRPSGRAPQRAQSPGLRSSAVTSTYRSPVSRSRSSSTLLSQSTPNVRAGSLSTSISSGQARTQAIGGISSGGTLTSGTALFNGKEISVDGLKEGQMFDENLQPIMAGISGTTADRSAIITSTEEISNIPLGNMEQIPVAVLTQTEGLRSSVIGGSSRGASRTSSSLLSQPALIGVDGSLSNAISYEAGLSQAGVASRSGGSLTSGTALFNGQEIRIDGLKEGQMFDENLQPIMPGAAGIIAEKPSVVLSSGQTAGIPPRSVIAPKPISRSPQRLQTGTLRSSTTGSSRRTGTVLTQASPSVRARPLSNSISSEAGSSQTMGGLRSGGSLTSGKVLFNGKEISIDGLKEGQMFDENLRPILPGSNGITAQRPATISSSAQISGVPSRSAAPKPILRGPQRIQTGNLRSSAITSSSRGAISTSRRTSTLSQVAPQRLQTGNLRSGTITSSSRGTISSARRTNTLVSQPAPAIRAGQLSTTTLTGQGNAQMLGGARSSGSLTSGTVLFNGKEIKVEGLKEGQLFDENLQPITSGITGFVSEKSAILPGISQTGGTSSVSAVPNAMLTSQRSQAGAIRSSVAGGFSRPTFSSTRSSAASLGSTGNLRPAAIISNTPLTSGPQASGIVRSGGVLTSGTVLFDGKEIPIDGLKAGQIFDENLRPITTGTSGSLSETSMNGFGFTQTSGAPSGTIPKPRVRSSQRVGAAGLRSSVTRGSSSGAFTSSRISGPQSAPGMRSGILANTISSTGRRSQAIVGTRSQGSVTSGTALFNGKEIAIDGLREGQMFDENLKPILSGTSGTLAGRMSTTLQNSGQISTAPSAGAAPKPRLRSQVGGSRSSVTSNYARGEISSSRTLGSPLSKPAPSLRGGSLGTSVSSGQGISSTTGTVRSESGSVLFNGKEISMGELKPGQLYDENLRPITSGISGMIAEKSASLPGSAQISNIPSQNVAPKPRMRTPQGSRIGGLRTSVVSSSSTSAAGSSRTVGGTSRSAANVRSGALPLITSPQSAPAQSYQSAPGIRSAGSLTSGAAFSSGMSPAQGLPQTFGGARSRGSLTSGTVLFNDKEISIDGLKEGQLFDENLRPIDSVGGYVGGISSSDSLSNVQRPSTRNFRPGTSSATAGLRSQTTSIRGSPAASGSLNYIDVTRTDDSLASSRSSSENILGSRRIGSAQSTTGGAWEYASRFGSKMSQDRITPEISQYGVDDPVQESILNIPDDPFKKATSMKAPSMSRQTQLKVEDVLQQSSLTKLDALRSVQETVPFSIPESSKKIAQLSQKDIDIPTVQEKLLGGFSGYLPKTSFLSPFNYALPQDSASKYSVKSPMSQVQQKMEQVFI